MEDSLGLDQTVICGVHHIFCKIWKTLRTTIIIQIQFMTKKYTIKIVFCQGKEDKKSTTGVV